MVKKLVLVLAAAVALLAAVIATRPPGYRVERSALVAAPAELVYAQVADFRRWEAWSPWAKLDPKQRSDFEGPPAGVGAGYHWAGNEKVGEGRMTITGAVPPRELSIRLQFIKPWEQTSTTAFTFVPEGGATRVTWSMSGSFDLMGRAMTLFMNMDRQVGPDFEKGLQALRRVAESQAGAPVPGAAPGPAPAP
jgi:uncharacterized protein YndB with AHSA1/START domain